MLRTYTHRLPSRETRTRKAIGDALTEAGAKGDVDSAVGQGTSVPPPHPCALTVPWPPGGSSRHMTRPGFVKPRPDPRITSSPVAAVVRVRMRGVTVGRILLTCSARFTVWPQCA
jgi:hypothetical protein